MTFEDCDNENEDRKMPLHVGWDGLVCKDWSRFNRTGLRGASGLYEYLHHINLLQIHTAQVNEVEDVRFIECAEDYPVESKVKDQLYGISVVKHLIAGPSSIGFPVRRVRTFAAACNLKTVVWVGPQTTEGIHAEFHALFGRACDVNGDIFMCAREEEVIANIQRLTQQRKNKVFSHQIDANDTVDLLVKMYPQGVLNRKAEYDKVYESDSKFYGEHGAYLADLAHHMGQGPAGGTFFPTASTHPMVFSWKKKRMALPAEVLTSQGLDMYPELCGRRGLSKLGRTMRSQLSDPQLMFAAGNSAHIPLISAWMMYVFSNLMLVSEFYKIHVVPSKSQGSEEEDV